jgi:ABC-2 type transport system ATP-binding protein
LHSPKVLFMDEPTVGLDPASRRQIWESLKELKSLGVTILLTTHYLEEAELLADRIGIIRAGKIVAEGTIDELRHRIRGIRGIAIRLSERLDDENLQAILVELKGRFGAQPQYDALRQTINLAQPADSELVHSLETILSWLSEKNIAFSHFSTSEPSLEDVFLAISHNPKDAAPLK